MKTLLFSLIVSTTLFAQDSFRAQVMGKGQPMILIPGLSSSGETWNTTVARYKDRYECHVLTLAGFVGVPRVDTPPGEMLAKVREDLAQYIRTKKLAKLVIVGHSLGGFLAMDLASKYPDLPGKVLIVDTYPFTMGLSPGMTPEMAKSISVQIREGIAGMTADAYAAYAKAGTSTNNMVTAKADQERLIEWAAASDRIAVADALAGMLGADLREQVAAIKVPTMVLAAWRGNEQYAATYQSVEKAMRDQYAKVAGVEIHVSDTSRHFIMWDDPQWMFGHLDRFLGTK